MQCSACKYEFTMREIQENSVCPRCEERRLRDEAATDARETKAINAALMAPHVRKLVEEHRGSQPVVIVDIRMNLHSMVWFMVKWVIASIPAMIILGLIMIAFMSFFGGLIGALSR